MENASTTAISKKSVAVFIAMYAIYGLAQASNEFQTLFLKVHGLSATECGWVLSSASLLAILGGTFASAIADKLRSRRIVFAIFTALWAVLMAVLLLTRNYRIAGFALCAGIIPLAKTCDSVSYNQLETCGATCALKVPKLDFSLIRVCLSIGYCVINFAYTPLVSRFGPTFPFICTAAFTLLLVLLSGTLKNFESSAPSAERKREKLDVSRIFKSYYLMTYIVLGLFLAAGSSSGSFLVYLMTEIGMDTALIGTANGIRVIGEIVVMLLLPFIRRRVSVPFLLGMSAFISSVQMVMYLTCRSPILILIALSLGGVSGGLTLGTRPIYLLKLAPKGLETFTITLNSSVFTAGYIIMSFLGGIIIDGSGIYALYIVSLICQLFWLLMYFGSWAFGWKVLKKEPPTPMFLKN